MPEVAPFETHHERYDAWFKKHEAAYVSELLALRPFVPWEGRGVEIGVGSGRFAAPLGVQVAALPGSLRRLPASLPPPRGSLPPRSANRGSGARQTRSRVSCMRDARWPWSVPRSGTPAVSAFSKRSAITCPGDPAEGLFLWRHGDVHRRDRKKR